MLFDQLIIFQSFLIRKFSIIAFSRAKTCEEKNIICEKKNHNSFKIYVSGEVIKNIGSSNETQKTNVSSVLNQTNKIKCTYAANIE